MDDNIADNALGFHFCYHQMLHKVFLVIYFHLPEYAAFSACLRWNLSFKYTIL